MFESKHLSCFLRAEMKRIGWQYNDLQRALAEEGVEDNVRNLRNKIARGTFSASFFFTCLRALGVTVLSIDPGEIEAKQRRKFVDA